MLKQKWKRTGEKPAELEMPEIPDGFDYLLNCYFQIKRTSDPLSWQELESWNNLNGSPLSGADCQALMSIDYQILQERR